MDGCKRMGDVDVEMNGLMNMEMRDGWMWMDGLRRLWLNAAERQASC